MPATLNAETPRAAASGMLQPEVDATPPVPPWVQRKPRSGSPGTGTRCSAGDRVVINYSTMQPVGPRPIRVRHRCSFEELLERAAASVERKGKGLNLGRFNPLPQGRPLTRFEKIAGLVLAAAFSAAVWIHALPAPISARAGYFQSLALTAGREVSSGQAFTEATLGSIGREWKASVLFARVHPLFWRRAPAVHPDALVQRVEAGLAALARHGPALSVTVFGLPALGSLDRADGTSAVTSRVSGQVELADGTVVRLGALLLQDEATKQWGLVELTLPPFLP